MRLRPRTLLGLAVLLPITLLVPAGPVAAEPTFGPKYSVDAPATTVASRTDRRPMAGGIYDAKVNKTFISWSGVNADSYLQEYDHRRKTYSAPMFLDGGLGDPHNYPTMIQADNGKLLIFRGMHNVELVMSEAPKPHSAAGTWTHRVIPEGIAASYPMPFKAANGDIYVFYRRTDDTIDQGAGRPAADAVRPLHRRRQDLAELHPAHRPGLRRRHDRPPGQHGRGLLRPDAVRGRVVRSQGARAHRLDAGWRWPGGGEARPVPPEHPLRLLPAVQPALLQCGRPSTSASRSATTTWTA